MLDYGGLYAQKTAGGALNPNGGRRGVHTSRTHGTTGVNITEVLRYGVDNTEYLGHTLKCF